ncbi:hypothetical protein GCK72_011358 [Caenorhabditis remanei]|uniref:RING-type domain-containing protein n=1 Tax=Caenorhabditis remanei TaxID=31234 RepID=A0A6A5H9I9_CAERE|nr:hypothetical protein GCK72_011358 [Caenorhabditis remanei]KAF1763093.1 hypothetical protein GCK72_011358 [Caenorhabditis remanei]
MYYAALYTTPRYNYGYSGKEPNIFKFKNIVTVGQIVNFALIIFYFSIWILIGSGTFEGVVLYETPKSLIVPILSVTIIPRIFLLVYDSTTKTEEIDKCRRNLSIGYGGMALCGVAAQALTVLMRNRNNELLAYSLPCSLIALLLFLLFVSLPLEDYKMKPETKRTAQFLRIIVAIFHFVVGALLLLFTYFCSEFKVFQKASFGIIHSFLMFMPCTAEVSTSTVARVQYLRTTVPKKVEKVERNNSNLNMEDENEPKHCTSPLECSICMLRYTTTTVIPRMLTACGHTVCQRCVEKMPKEEDDVILCPFCRKRTLLPDGHAHRLPKNYAILEMIEEHF